MDTFFIYTVGITLSVFALYFFGVAVAPYVPDSVKDDYFECGLPVSSHIPKKANFDFFIYAVMFIVVDMTALFLTLFVFADTVYSKVVASAFAVVIALAIFIAMTELHRQKEA